jgi:uncharacterized membrane protein
MSSRRRREARVEAHQTAARAADRPLALAVVGAALGAFAVALYLTAERLAGVPLVCGPFGGCDVVQASPYAMVGPLPVAVIGLVGSGLVLGLAALSWRRQDGRALRAIYVLGIAGLVVVAYLTSLELFVIRAICTWCVAFAVLFGLVTALAAAALRRA